MLFDKNELNENRTVRTEQTSDSLNLLALTADQCTPPFIGLVQPDLAADSPPEGNNKRTQQATERQQGIRVDSLGRVVEIRDFARFTYVLGSSQLRSANVSLPGQSLEFTLQPNGNYSMRQLNAGQEVAREEVRDLVVVPNGNVTVRLANGTTRIFRRDGTSHSVNQQPE